MIEHNTCDRCEAYLCEDCGSMEGGKCLDEKCIHEVNHPAYEVLCEICRDDEGIK